MSPASWPIEYERGCAGKDRREKGESLIDGSALTAATQPIAVEVAHTPAFAARRLARLCVAFTAAIARSD